MPPSDRPSVLRAAGHRMVRDGAAVLWRTVFALFALLVFFLVLPGLVGAFLLGWAIQHAAGAPERDKKTTLLAGLALLATLSPPLFAVPVTLLLLPTHAQHGVVGALSLLVGVVLFGVLSAPFLTTCAHLLRRGEGMVDAIGHAIAASALLGARAMLVRGAVVGLSIALPPFALVLGGVESLSAGTRDLVHLVDPFLAVPAVAWWLVAFVGASSDEDDLQLSASSPPLGWRRSWPWLVPSGTLVLALASLALAALTPLRAWQPPPPGVSLFQCAPEIHGEGPHGLDVVPTEVPRELTAPHGFVVSTADGGGAGLLAGRRGSTPMEVCLSPERDVYWLRFRNTGTAIPIDLRGVRLDDGIVDRITERAGRFGAGLMLVGVLLLFGLARHLGRGLSHLYALELEGDALRTVRGTLEAQGGAALVRDRMNGRTTGDVTLVSDDGATRVRLPVTVTVLGHRDAAQVERLGHGTPARLLSNAPLSSASLRTAQNEWPASGVLLIGATSDARAAIIGALSRVAAPWVVGASLAFGLAAVWVLFQL